MISRRALVLGSGAAAAVGMTPRFAAARGQAVGPTHRSVRVQLDGRAGAVERNAAEAFARRLRQRGVGRVTVSTASGPAGEDLIVRVGVAGQRRIDSILSTLKLARPGKPEAFLLEVHASDGGNEAVVCGRDARGVVYGLGELLRRFTFASGGVAIAPLSLVDSPATAERGVYFATHFNNYYERAPIEEIEDYVEDMAFWGFNSLWTWFDMNWYPADFDRDPHSRGMEMLARIRRINARAAGLGLTTGLVGVANEGFRLHALGKVMFADPSDRRGGFYPESSVCPSMPGGLDLILADRRKVLSLVGPIDAFAVWPYDQGSCGCPSCRPWPATFLRIAPAIAREVRRVSPEARFYVSTWMFKDDEMGLVKALSDTRPDWLDGFLSDTSWADKFAPTGGQARLVFPEISMAGSLFTGYGASGANPMPAKFAAEAEHVAARGFGAIVYSEGIYEDVNKVVWARSLWSPGRPARTIVHDYAAWHFGLDRAGDWEKLIAGLEASWPPAELNRKDPAIVHALFRDAERLGTLPLDPGGRTRWQYLRDRAEMDSMMVRIGGDRALLRDMKLTLDDAGYTQDFRAFRERLRAFRGKVSERVAAIDRLFAAHWAYLEHAYLERTTGFVITPPDFMGQRDWDTMLELLDRALAERDDERMRKIVLAGFKRWFWHNNISFADVEALL